MGLFDWWGDQMPDWAGGDGSGASVTPYQSPEQAQVASAIMPLIQMMTQAAQNPVTFQGMKQRRPGAPTPQQNPFQPAAQPRQQPPGPGPQQPGPGPGPFRPPGGGGGNPMMNMLMGGGRNLAGMPGPGPQAQPMGGQPSIPPQAVAQLQQMMDQGLGNPSMTQPFMGGRIPGIPNVGVGAQGMNPTFQPSPIQQAIDNPLGDAGTLNTGDPQMPGSFDFMNKEGYQAPGEEGASILEKILGGVGAAGSKVMQGADYINDKSLMQKMMLQALIPGIAPISAVAGGVRDFGSGFQTEGANRALGYSGTETAGFRNDDPAYAGAMNPYRDSTMSNVGAGAGGVWDWVMKALFGSRNSGPEPEDYLGIPGLGNSPANPRG